MIGALPESLTVAEVEYPIRSDYRNVLQIFEAFQDSELEKWEKWTVAIYMIFECFQNDDDVEQAVLSGFDLDEAAGQISWFISAGRPEREMHEMPLYDWRKDEQMIFSAVNKVAGRETRELDYLHWWTFLGYFNEVGEGTFSYIVGIRDKLNHGKKLEKHEKEFLAKNKELISLKPPLTKEEQEKEDEFQALLTEVLG